MRWNSIRTKLIVFLLIATAVPIAATMVVSYSYSVQSIKNRTLEDTDNLLFQGQRNIAGLLEELNRASLNVYSDSELNRQLQAGLADFQTDARAFASLSYIQSAVADVHQVYLYAGLGNRAMIVTEAAGARRAENVGPFIDAARFGPDGSANVYVQPAHMSHTYGFASLQPQQRTERVFTLHRRIERVPLEETIGYLSIDVKLTQLADVAEQLYDRQEERLYVIDGDGIAVYAGDEELIGKPLQEPWYEEQVKGVRNGGEAPASGYFERGGTLFVFMPVSTGIADWTLVKSIPTSYLAREANRAALINLLLLAVSLIVISAATVIVSIRLTAPIKRLVNYMSAVQAGNLQVAVEPEGKDEIGFVVKRFRSMMDTINNLFLREYRLELANKSNQLRALQAQINPHFLNNTIQIIGTLALELGVPRIYALLSALARMMRYSMDNDSGLIKLRDEMAYLKDYIELQKERYEDRFRFEAEADEDVLDAVMPKMLLQPVIENYFKHGMDKSASDGLLTVKARAAAGNRIEIVVANNGRPIPADRLDQLKRELEEVRLRSGMRPPAWEEAHAGPEAEGAGRDADSAGTKERAESALRQAQDGAEAGIGLHNVWARMVMVYGDDARLDIANADGGGVVIRMRIGHSAERRGLADDGADRG